MPEARNILGRLGREFEIILKQLINTKPKQTVTPLHVGTLEKSHLAVQ